MKDKDRTMCPEELRPEDEKQIFSEAKSTMKETRTQLDRVQDILAQEIRRLDHYLDKR